MYTQTIRAIQNSCGRVQRPDRRHEVMERCAGNQELFGKLVCKLLFAGFLVALRTTQQVRVDHWALLAQTIAVLDVPELVDQRMPEVIDSIVSERQHDNRGSLL